MGSSALLLSGRHAAADEQPEEDRHIEAHETWGDRSMEGGSEAEAEASICAAVQ